MEHLVNKFIRRHHLIEEGTLIVVGVSGGPDSMALLHFLTQNKSLWNISVIACTVDHMLRGSDSKEDLRYVERHCKEFDIPFEGRRVDVNAYKKQHGLSTEVAARECRYNAFKEVMDKHQARYLALAHHGDDQIETMLMRQVNGSFGLAKSGIPFKRSFDNGYIIRPFLTISKDMIEQYCQKVGIVPRRDSSNSSLDIVRNRFRHHILPFLKQENPKVHFRYQQESELIREDELFLEGLAKDYLKQVLVIRKKDKVIISINHMLKIPLPLQRRLIHLILNYLYSNKGHKHRYQSIHIQDILFIINEKVSSGQSHLPDGLVVVRSYDQCIFSYQFPGEEYYSHNTQLEVPGKIKTLVGDLYARVANELPDGVMNKSHFVCDLDQIHLPLTVRSRLNGDRMLIRGMNGTKKVKDIFIDQKIGHEKRKVWPVVTDAKGNILWLPLLKQSSLGQISSRTKLFLILSFVTYG